MTTRFIRIKEVQHRVSKSRTTIWREEREGRFPKRIQIGTNSVAWLESDIDHYINERVLIDNTPNSAGRRNIDMKRVLESLECSVSSQIGSKKKCSVNSAHLAEFLGSYYRILTRMIAAESTLKQIRKNQE